MVHLLKFLKQTWDHSRRAHCTFLAYETSKHGERVPLKRTGKTLLAGVTKATILLSGPSLLASA